MRDDESPDSLSNQYNKNVLQNRNYIAHEKSRNFIINSPGDATSVFLCDTPTQYSQVFLLVPFVLLKFCQLEHDISLHNMKEKFYNNNEVKKAYMFLPYTALIRGPSAKVDSA